MHLCPQLSACPVIRSKQIASIDAVLLSRDLVDLLPHDLHETR